MGSAIEIQGVSKRFRLYHEKYSTLKERVIHAGQVPYEEFWALKDVHAEIPTGQTVGILGRNGSGKSTLLKCIAGILQPTRGQVVVRGQLAAMLELGAGFQPELSGRDNVYLNGSLLGFSRKEIDQRFEEIVAFAELEDFIDQQVKYYSSGMYVRLGFSVAVSVNPDILLVDEVLAVGDERFQEKCIERIRQFQEEGRTIVVVSHSPDTMRAICNSVMVIDHGKLVTFAPSGEAVRIFRELLLDGAPREAPSESSPAAPSPVPLLRPIKLTGATVDYPRKDERQYLQSGESLSIRVGYEVLEPLEGLNFKVAILTEGGGNVFSSTSGRATEGMVFGRGVGSVEFVFDSVPLLDGRFVVTITAVDAHEVTLDRADNACVFEVMNPGRATGTVAMPMRVAVEPPGSIAYAH